MALESVKQVHDDGGDEGNSLRPRLHAPSPQEVAREIKERCVDILFVGGVQVDRDSCVRVIAAGSTLVRWRVSDHGRERKGKREIQF